MKTTISKFKNINIYMSENSMVLPLVETDAWIWNGQKQLPGQLQIWPDRLCFQLLEFPDSHLKLEILRSDIQEIDSYGGMAKAIEQGIPKMRIEEASALKQSRIDNNTEYIVGVNVFIPEEDEKRIKGDDNINNLIY